MRLQYRQSGEWSDHHAWHPEPAEATIWRVVGDQGRMEFCGSRSQCDYYMAAYYNRAACFSRS